MNGAEGNENHISIQRFAFGSAWPEMVKQFLLCKLFKLLLGGDLKGTVY